MAKVYIACPYSHVDKEVMVSRFKQVNKVAGKLMREGHIVFSPISHSHPIAEEIGGHLDHDFWLNQDFEFIRWCSDLYVLALPGWGDSTGIKRELEYAALMGKKIMFIQFEDYAD